MTTEFSYHMLLLRPVVYPLDNIGGISVGVCPNLVKDTECAVIDEQNIQKGYSFIVRNIMQPEIPL